MHAHHSPERLMAQLDGARLVKYDGDGYVLAWFGGHGVHAYDATGREVDYWNTGSFADNDASPSEVEESMSRWILGADDDEEEDKTESIPRSATAAEVDYETLRETVRADGRSAGIAAGSWVIDGNTPESSCREIVRMFDEGDPVVYDAMPSPLCGEWADDPTPADVLARCGVDAETLGIDDGTELLDEWEDGFREGWEDEVRRSAQAMVTEECAR